MHEGGLDLARFTLVALAQALMLLILAGMQTMVARAGLFDPSAPRVLTDRPWLPGTVRAAGFLVSIPLFLVIGKLACLLWAFAPSLFAWAQRRLVTRGPRTAS